jgi:probable phosphoglycerate mutase
MSFPLQTLRLVRHGQTDWNVQGLAQGHTDIPLNALGKDQARLLTSAFRVIDVDEIWVSDLLRAQQTADGVASATGARMRTWPELRERGFGEWEGQSFAAIKASGKATDWHDADFRPPQGESKRDVWNRLSAVESELFETAHRSIVLVSHGMTLSILLARLVHDDLERSNDYRNRNCAITELVRGAHGRYDVAVFDDLSHLLAEGNLA